MYKTVLMLVAALAACQVTAATVSTAGRMVDDAFYAMANLPAELVGVCPVGEDIDLKIEENASAGYVWSAVYDPRIITVEINHQAPRSAVAGAPGFAEIELKPLTAGPVAVTLNYSRPFESGVAPARTVKCILNPAAAPAMTTAPAPAAPVMAAVATAAGATAVTTAGAAPVAVESLPLLYDDAYYRLSRVPAALQVRIPVGEDLEFELEEQPDAGFLWSVASYDPTFCRVGIEHKPEGFFRRPKADIEIKALRSGASTVELIGGAGASAKRLVLHFRID